MLCPPGTNAPASGRDSGAGDVLSRQLAAFAPRERGAGLVPASAGHTSQFSFGEIVSKGGNAASYFEVGSVGGVLSRPNRKSHIPF
jgi:hypothetical protein